MHYAIESNEMAFALPSRRFLLALALFISMAAVAFGITIDTRTAPYNSAGGDVNTTTNGDAVEVRTAVDTRLAGIYRLTHGIDTLPTGSVFTVIYHDGSGEKAGVDSPFSTMGAVPIPGSQFGGDCDMAPCSPGPTTTQH